MPSQSSVPAIGGSCTFPAMTDAFAPPVSRKLPAKWTAKARQAVVALNPPELVRRVGNPAAPVLYRVIMRREPAWRVALCAVSLCAVDDCEVSGALVFDHCHDHGWLRGAVCARHNVRLGQIDAVRRIPGVQLDLSGTPYAALMAACPECTAIP